MWQAPVEVRLDPSVAGIVAKLWRPLIVAALVVPAGSAVAHAWAAPSDDGRAGPADPRRSARFATTFDVSAFLKGNIHTHTNLSDGDNAPEEVIGWYRKHGYDFLAITDHNRFFDPEAYRSLADEHMRLISGEEVSMRGGGKQVHVNALCTKYRVGGGTFSTPAEALGFATRAVASQLGVAIVNHPNFDSALSPEDLLSAEPAPLLEIMSGHPYVYSRGRDSRRSHETLWDFALGSGLDFMGVAVDDMHHLRVDADPPAFPGRGWVEVFGNRNDSEQICDALRQGHLYSSTGIVLRRIRVTARSYAVWPDGAGAKVAFIGLDGVELQRSEPLDSGAVASYTLSGNEAYVRARITREDGSFAWTPAVFVRSGQSPAPEPSGARKGPTFPQQGLE